MPVLRRGGKAICARGKGKGKKKRKGGPDLSFPLTAAAQAEKDAAAAAKKARLQLAQAKAPPRKPGWQDQGFYTSQRVCIAHLFRTTLNWPAKEDWKSTRIEGTRNRWSLGVVLILVLLVLLLVLLVLLVLVLLVLLVPVPVLQLVIIQILPLRRVRRSAEPPAKHPAAHQPLDRLDHAVDVVQLPPHFPPTVERLDPARSRVLLPSPPRLLERACRHCSVNLLHPPLTFGQ